MGLVDEKIRLIKANIVKEVDFEQQLAVDRLRGPEKASHAQGLHKQKYGRKNLEHISDNSGPTRKKEFITKLWELWTRAKLPFKYFWNVKAFPY